MPTKMHKDHSRTTQDFNLVSACLPTRNHEKNILRERAQQFAQTDIKKEVQDKTKLPYIHFRLGKNEHYGIPYQATKEVIQNIPITFVPSSHNFISGVINRRGMLVNVIDLNIFFGMTESVETNHSAIIIVQNKLMRVGLLVNAVEGNSYYSLEKLDPPIAADNAIKPNYIIGLHQGSIAIINIDNVLLEIEAHLTR